jgi:hypothetical protein
MNRTMDWLMFALTVPILPVVAIGGTWFWMRPVAPTRGTGGVTCDTAPASCTL